jgi:predicted lipoprotein
MPAALRCLTATLVCLAWAVLASCGSEAGDAVPGERGQMLQNTAANIILPAYRELAGEADRFAAAARQFATSPNLPMLRASRRAWRQTRAAWERTAAFQIGPSERLRTGAKIDWRTIRPDRIESILAGSSELTSPSVAELGANVKGFLALEYLLFDPDRSDAEVAASLAEDPRRRLFLSLLAGDLADNCVQLRDAWEPSGGGFAATLSTAWHGNADYPSIAAALDDIINRMIFLAEEIADTEILAPLGTRSGGVPRPDLVPTWRSDTAKADILAQLDSLSRVYSGTAEAERKPTLSSVVAGISPETDAAIIDTLLSARRAVASIPPPFTGALVNAPKSVSRAQVAVKQLMRYLEIDLVSVLGTTLRFNPNDGD